MAASAPCPSESEATWTCPACGTVVPPVEFELLGVKRRLPGHCPVCFPKEQEAEAERKRQAEIAKRKEPYLKYLPFDDPEYAGAYLERFEERDGFKVAVQYAKRFSEQLPKPNPQGLLIYGTRGNGKTSLSVAVARKADAAGMTVAWMEGRSTLRAWGGMETEDREDMIKLYCRADMLVIDDLGSDSMTPQRAGWLFTVIDHFYRKNKPLVVTSNYDPDDLAVALTPTRTDNDLKCQDGERILSRLVQMCDLVPNTATDYRMELAKRRLAGGAANA